VFIKMPPKASERLRNKDMVRGRDAFDEDTASDDDDVLAPSKGGKAAARVKATAGHPDHLTVFVRKGLANKWDSHLKMEMPYSSSKPAETVELPVGGLWSCPSAAWSGEPPSISMSPH
jgi:hypothetical protein